MKRILVALDSDTRAQRIALIGYRFAKAMQAETFLLHVTPESSYYSSLKYSPILGFEVLSALDVVETDNDLELKKRAEDFLEGIKEYIGDRSVEMIIQSGNIEQKILEIVADKKIDLVVMGTHRNHGFDKMFSGSVAEKVLHHCPVPLLIIPITPAE